MFKYRCNVLDRLREAGYTTYRIRKDKILAEETLMKIRSGVVVSLSQLDKICGLLNCEPWDLIEYVPGAGDIPEDASRG